MPDGAAFSLSALCASSFALYLLCMRFDPKKPHARMLRHGVIGLMLLLCWNLLPLPHIGMNPVSVMATGSLGLPGLALMAAVNTVLPLP